MSPLHAMHWRLNSQWRLSLMPMKESRSPMKCSRCPLPAVAIVWLHSGGIKVASLEFCLFHTPEKGDVPRFDVEGYPGDGVE